MLQEYESGRQRRLGKLSFVGHSIGMPENSVPFERTSVHALVIVRHNSFVAGMIGA